VLYPHPGEIPGGQGRVSQQVVTNVAGSVAFPNARMSQGALEISEVPTPSNARVGQMVIELMLPSDVLRNNVGVWGVTKGGKNATGAM
jgi:hypothetical protein